MSNQINIEPTKFENVRTGIVTQGIRVYDSYGSFYDNTWKSIPDDDLDVLRVIVQETSKGESSFLSDILDHISEMESGVSIGGEWYDWDEIADIMEEWQ